VATEILQEEATEKNIAKMVVSRAERGWKLYLAKRQLITRTGDDTYTVPSCSGRGRYTVRYGDSVENYTCTDYQVHGGELACKHVTAVALIHARRRRVRLRCEVCGTLSNEETLVGLRNDCRCGGPRYYLRHHPESIGQEVGRIAKNIKREAQIQGDG